MRLLVLFGLIILCLSGTSAAESGPSTAKSVAHTWGGKARHLVVAVIDGPRWSETWGASGQPDIPHQARELAPLGSRYDHFRNTGWTYTNCGHTAITTGFYEQIENAGNQLPARPSVFQFFRQATGLPAESTWVITSKDKLFILGNTSDPTWKDRLQPSLDCGVPARGPFGGYRDDRLTVAAAKAVLTAHHPALLLINFKEPDAAGHAKNWPGYLQGIRDTDGYVAELWQHIQADPELKDRTDLFITNDHGRHLDGHGDGYISHGDDCEGCRQISLLAVGPDIAVGQVFQDVRTQVDLGVTIAHLAGVTLPGSPGHLLTEMLVTVPSETEKK